MLVEDGRNVSGARWFMLMCFIASAIALGERPAHAQGRDGLLNGTVVGAGVGAGIGVAFTHAVRDSDLGFSQYARGALIFGALGAGIGVGVDALLTRVSPDRGVPPRRVTITPTIWRNVGGVVVKWRW